MACYVSATLAKETGYTMLGVLLAYDVFTFGVPIYYWASVQSNSASPLAGPAPTNEDKAARASALRAFVGRVVIILVFGAAYLYARKVLTVHFVVHNFRKVENPIAFQQGTANRLSLHLSRRETRL